MSSWSEGFVFELSLRGRELGSWKAEGQGIGSPDNKVVMRYSHNENLPNVLNLITQNFL